MTVKDLVYFASLFRQERAPKVFRVFFAVLDKKTELSSSFIEASSERGMNRGMQIHRSVPFCRQIRQSANNFVQIRKVKAISKTGNGGIGKSGNGERGTGNGERGTGNGERGTGNGERGTGNGERGTGNGERGTGNGERGTGTGNEERGTGNGERGISKRRNL